MSILTKFKNDWDLIVACLHGEGELREFLSVEQKKAVFCLGDGFGSDLSWEQIERINGGWDWSHVRDSSKDAVEAMASKIRDYLAAH